MKITQRRISLRIITEDNEAIEINSADANPQLMVDIGCTMSVSPDANSATVRIANLSKATRLAIAGRVKRNLDISKALAGVPERLASGVPSVIEEVVTRRGDAYVEVDAGYDTGVARIFEGSSQYARHYKTGPTWFTEIQVGDGLSTMMAGVAARVFQPGSLFIDVLRYAVRAMALDDSHLTPATLQAAIGGGETTMPYGITTFGDAKWFVSNMLEPFGAEWFVDRGQFFVVKQGHALSEPAVDLDFDSGLINQPEPLENDGVRVRSIFRSDIRVGRLVHISGVDYDGVYRVDVVNHRVNNFTGEAITEASMSVPETL